MKKRVIVFSGLLLVSSMWMKADENETAKDKENTFSMSAQIRPRAEYRNGVLNPRSEGQEPAGFINNRARLSMNYERQNLSIGLSAQHVGVWGQDPQIDKNGRFILNGTDIFSCGSKRSGAGNLRRVTSRSSMVMAPGTASAAKQTA